MVSQDDPAPRHSNHLQAIKYVTGDLCSLAAVEEAVQGAASCLCCAGR